MAIKGKKVRLSARERKKLRIRKRVRSSTDRFRLSVFRSSKHIYAQVVSDETGKVLVNASTLQPEVRSELEKLVANSKGASANDEGSAGAAPASNATSTKSILAARAVGLVLARKGKDQNVARVVFDRNGYVYHGRVQALADGAREGGFEF